MGTTRAVIGIVATQPQAEMIVVELHRSRFDTGDVSVLVPDQPGAVPRTGAVGFSGSTLTMLVGNGALAIRGLGSFIAAGPIVAILSGAAATAAVGMTSALIALGIPKGQAESYESKLRDGNILISVHTDDADMRQRARGILERNSATDVASVEDSFVSAGAGSASA